MELKLWMDREKGLIDPELYAKRAEEWAKKFNEEKQKDRSTNRSTQIRKFYDELIRCRDFWDSDQSDPSVLPLVKMLNAKAAYAKGRGHVSETFYEFIQKGVEQVQEKKDLDNFVLLFEAVICYYKKLNPVET